MGVREKLEQILGEGRPLTAREIAAQCERLTKREVNSALYSGELTGRFRRSDDQRPRWALAGTPGQVDDDGRGSRMSGRGGRDLGHLLAPCRGWTAAEINAGYDLGVNMASKHQVREVVQRLADNEGIALDSAGETTQRVIRVENATGMPAEDLQLGAVPFSQLAMTPFDRSHVRQRIRCFEVVVFSREADLSSSRFLGVRRWSLDDGALELAEADYEQARAAVRRSDLGAIPRGQSVNILRYGTKGRRGADTDELPDRSAATKRAFYVVKRYLGRALAEAADVVSEAGTRSSRDGAAEVSGTRHGESPPLSENAGLLLQLLGESRR